jgi:leader peptidase (prepilin peptidase) / N-methyltransferase
MNIELFAAGVTLLALLCGLVMLIVLTIIDFKERLLPNTYILVFAICGLLFHLMTEFRITEAMSMLYGAIVGGGFLFLIRAWGNRHYKQESLGMGDVKLMAAAGLWLGPVYVIHAITIGASLGIIHGVVYAVVKKEPLKKLEIPFGPGLIAGTVIVLGWLLGHNLSLWLGVLL